MTIQTTHGPRPQAKMIRYISLMQVIGIICVVLSHSFHEYPDSGYGHRLLAHGLLYSFMMPLFLFVSGFLMAYTSFLSGRKPDLKRFTSGKLKRLMLPFFVLTMVTFLPRASLSYMADDPIHLGMKEFVKGFFFTSALPIPYFWFIQAVFILLLIGFCYLYAMRKVKVRPGIYNTLLIIFFMLIPLVEIPFDDFFSIQKVVNMGIFFALGIVYAHYEGAVGQVIPWASPVTFIVCVAAWLGLYFISGKEGIGYTLCSVFGIAMCCSLSHWLVKRNITCLDHLSGANYIIFLLSWYFNVGAQQVLGHFVDWPWWIHSLLSLFFGIYAPWWIYRWLERHKDKRVARICSVLLGQSIR